MEKRIIQGVVAAAVLALGSLAYGQTSNAIPSEETFEGMTPGDSILVPNNTNGWYGDTNSTIAIATNLSYTYTNSLRPVESAAHTKVLQFSDGSLTNVFNNYNAIDSSTATNMTVDFMIKPVPYDGEPSSNLVAGSQTALYVDTNGVHVWYGKNNDASTNAWMTFTNAALGTADWARVTVMFDYTGDLANGGSGFSFFKVTINGLPLTPTNGSGYSIQGVDGYVQNGGDFLYTAKQTKQIHAFALSGSGMLDDFVITTNAVTNFFAPGANTFELTGIAGTHGTVSPTSTNVTAGNSQLFVVTAQSYYRIASLTTNGTSVGVFNNNSTSTNYTWVNVQATGTLAATFMAQVAGNATATPYWWMAQHGLTNGGASFDQAAVADQDRDGMQAWQEFIVGTDPTNAASVLKVLSITSDGVSQTVKWLSSTGAPNYSLLYSTNLVGNSGWVTTTNIIVVDAPTNSATFTPTSQPVFYKIVVTN